MASELRRTTIRYYNRNKKGTMLHVLEEDMKRARTEIQRINFTTVEFVGPPCPGFDYTYDQLMLMFWSFANNKPRPFVWKFTSATNKLWHEVCKKICDRLKAEFPDELIPNSAERFTTFEEFKEFIEK
jgi:hypothetical protein